MTARIRILSMRVDNGKWLAPKVRISINEAYMMASSLLPGMPPEEIERAYTRYVNAGPSQSDREMILKHAPRQSASGDGLECPAGCEALTRDELEGWLHAFTAANWISPQPPLTQHEIDAAIYETVDRRVNPGSADYTYEQAAVRRTAGAQNAQAKGQAVTALLRARGIDVVMHDHD